MHELYCALLIISPLLYCDFIALTAFFAVCIQQFSCLAAKCCNKLDLTWLWYQDLLEIQTYLVPKYGVGYCIPRPWTLQHFICCCRPCFCINLHAVYELTCWNDFRDKQGVLKLMVGLGHTPAIYHLPGNVISATVGLVYINMFVRISQTLAQWFFCYSLYVTYSRLSWFPASCWVHLK